jgi:opacity protein-like surface antigen
LALGTGVRATAVSTSALAYNPAGLAVGRLYHVEGIVDYMPDMKTVGLGGAIVDSSTSRLAAGVAFRGFLSGNTGLGGFDGRLGLGFPLSDSISIGLTGRYLNVKRDGDMVAELPASSREVKGFTMDASLRVVPVPMLMLYAGSYNLISLDSVYTPLLLGGGAGVALGTIAVLGADVLVDMTSYDKAAVTAGGGAEFFAAQVVPIRVGYSFDVKRSQHTLTLGLGYTDRSVGLDLSLRQDLGGESDTRVMGAFRFFVH